MFTCEPGNLSWVAVGLPAIASGLLGDLSCLCLWHGAAGIQFTALVLAHLQHARSAIIMNIISGLSSLY